jgi:hypothetical protein
MGGPGIGKTTCLRKLALDEAAREEEDPKQRLPIYIQLREIVGNFDIMNAIQNALKCQARRAARDELNSLNNSGRLLLLLDGLDEVHERSRNQFVAEILQTARKFPRLGIYISTRQWDYHWRFPGFLHVQLQEFDLSQIQEWIYRRLPKTDWKTTNHLISACNSDNELAELSGQPILLALIAAVFELTGKIPRRRSDIIARFLDAILESWDTSRGVRRSDDEALKEDKMELMCRLALHSWERSSLTFVEDEFAEIGGNWSDTLSSQAQRSILRDTGIFRPNRGSIKTWAFTHQVFRDYLAAHCLVARPDSFLERVLRNQDEDADLFLWRHACSVTSDASPLLSVLMENPALTDYQPERWLAHALADGVNLPKDQQLQVVKRILDKVNSASTNLTIVEFSNEKQAWRLVLSMKGELEGSVLKAITDLILTVVRTGWTSLYHQLFAEVARSDSELVNIIKTISQSDWIVESRLDDANQKAILQGRIPGTSAEDETNP